MKKVFSFAAIAALTMFAASCGNGEAEAKRIADSTHMADSLATIAMQAKADSTHMADSLAAAKKGGAKPKTPEQKQKIENKKATGGRG